MGSKPLLQKMDTYEEERDYKSSFFLFSFVFSLLLGAVIFGYNLSVFNAQVEFMAFKLQWNDDQERFYTAIMISIVCFGAIVGVSSTWALADYFTRKQIILILDSLLIIGSLLTLIEIEVVIIIGRFVIGIGIGISSYAIPVFLREIAPNSIRGKIGGFFEVGIVTGQLIAYLIGLGIPSKINGVYEDPDSNWWKIMLALPIIMSAIQFFLISIVFNLESPFLLYINGQQQECENTLRKIYKEEKISAYILDMEFEKQHYDLERSITFSGIFLHYKKPLLYACIIFAFQQFTGNTVISVYADRLFRRNAHNSISDTLGRLLSAFFIVLKLIFSILSSFVIDNRGRRGILLIGTVGVAFCHYSLALVSYYESFFLSVLFLNLFIVFFSSSMGPFPWKFAAEILPAKGVTLATIDSWIFSFLNTYPFPYLVMSIGYSGVYIYYGTLTTLCFIFIFYFIPETSKLSRREIDQRFKGNNNENGEFYEMREFENHK